MKGCYLVLLILTFSLSINAQNLLDRKIDFSVTQISVPQALKLLGEQTGIPISFSSNFFKASQSFSLQIEQQTIRQVLQSILGNYSLDFKIQGKRVLIFKAKPPVYTISGYLEDANSGERLVAGTVYCEEQKIGTTSNEYGFFSLTLPSGNTTLIIDYLGYQTSMRNYDLEKDLQVNLDLKSAYDLPEVIVLPKEKETRPDANQSTYFVDREKVTTLPGLGGEPDLMKNAQLLPGIQTPNQGLGGIIIRGGTNGQNLLLLDGVPVYIPYHLLGIYSIYNHRTINSAKILKGNFPARYGGRISSVFDVRTREGNKYDFAGEAGINLMSAKALIEGPIVKEKGSFLLAGRQSTTGFLLEPTLSNLYFQTDEGTLETNFYDFNIKSNFTFSEKDRLFLSVFSGGDEFSKKLVEEDEGETFEGEFELYWRNTIGSLRWNHLFSDRLFLNTTLTYSWFDYEQTIFEALVSDDPESEDDISFLDSRSENRDLGIRFDFNFVPSAKHNLRFGASISRKEFLPEVTFFDEEDEELQELDELDINSLQTLVAIEAHPVIDAVAYFEDDIHLLQNLKANIGVRNTAFLTEDRNYFSLEPRFSLQYHPKEKVSLKLSVGKMKQYLHLISNTAFSLPNDLWTPSSVDLLPQSSWQSEIGLTFNPNKKIQIDLDAYYKTMENLYAYPDDSDFLNQLDDDEVEKYLTKGNGRAYGVESYLQYEGASFGSKTSLSFGRIERQFELQNLGKTYPFEYDFPFQANIFLYKNIGDKFQFSVNWIYQSANPRFPFEVQALLGDNATMINPTGQKNATRGIDYHRLDVQLSYSQKFGHYAHRLSIGANNIYNRANAAYFQLIDNNNIESVPALPILPALSYSLKLGNFSSSR